MTRRHFHFVAAWGGACLLAWLAASASAQETRPRGQLQEPVFRVGKNEPATKPVDEHPLDPALRLAYDGLEHLRRDVRDYTATLVKQERIKGELQDQYFYFVKVRNRQTVDGRVVVPMSVYLRFLKPKQFSGREVIWVENQREGKLIGHDTAYPNIRLPPLDPKGWLAMSGHKYPITDIGFEVMVSRLIEKGERDRKRGEVEVQFFKNAKINGRSCTLLQVTHPVKRDYFDYNIAQIFIDDELQVPVRYAAWLWPTTPGAKPPLEEEYTYLDVKLNVGLTDKDFDPANPEYKFQ